MTTYHKSNLKILQENSTHYAVKNDGSIEIWSKGLILEDLNFKAELCYTIPENHSDDLFAIFERLDENNRYNYNEL